MIACVLISCFAAAVERKSDLSLLETPLIIHVAEMVYAASVEVIQQGIQPGMSLRKARAICPTAKLIPANFLKYRQSFEDILGILRTFTHLVEPEQNGWQAPQRKPRTKAKKGTGLVAQDQLAAVYYLDLETLKQPEAVKMARFIARAVEDKVNLGPGIGVASGKFPARIAATCAKPGAVEVVSAGTEAHFLAPLPVTSLPIDQDTTRRLRLFGIHTLQDLARLSSGSLTIQFGKTGRVLRQLAEGQDSRPVVPFQPTVKEQVVKHLESAVSDRTVLEAILRSMADELSLSLQRHGSMGRHLALTIHTEGGKVYEKTFALRQPVASAGHIAEIACHLLSKLTLTQSVTVIEVGIADLIQSAGRQLDLFVHQVGQDKLLRATLNDVIARYGRDCFYWITSVDDKARIAARSFKLTNIERS